MFDACDCCNGAQHGIVLSACASKPTRTLEPRPTEVVIAAPSLVPKIKILIWEQEPDDVDAFLDKLITNFMAGNPSIEVERAHSRNEELRDRFQSAGYHPTWKLPRIH